MRKHCDEASVPLLSDVLREVVFIQLLAGSPPQKHLLAVAEYCGVLLSCVASVFALHPRPTSL